ncbi:unnamed protein product, partial [marine sediment metagenome]
MLRVKVAAGELPPVEERLPEEPFVIDPLEEIGQYGGTLRTLRPNPDRDADISGILVELPLVDPPELIAPDEYKGNVFLSCKVGEEGKLFTFHMRKGLKWSDGYPVTSEDVLFNYEDILLNEKITPLYPRMLTAAGEPMKLEVIDDYTFRIRFAAS